MIDRILRNLVDIFMEECIELKLKVKKRKNLITYTKDNIKNTIMINNHCLDGYRITTDMKDCAYCYEISRNCCELTFHVNESKKIFKWFINNFPIVKEKPVFFCESDANIQKINHRLKKYAWTQNFADLRRNKKS